MQALNPQSNLYRKIAVICFLVFLASLIFYGLSLFGAISGTDLGNSTGGVGDTPTPNMAWTILNYMAMYLGPPLSGLAFTGMIIFAILSRSK